jgi:beta-1,4-N-acetylglucosaminyltransferase
MAKGRFVLITDRGGHLHNAKMLLGQLRAVPDAILTTDGPETPSLRKEGVRVVTIPYLFTWVGKTRWLNPFKILFSFFSAAYFALKLRPRKVVSLGALDVVPFCFVARLLGAQIIHVECMNQVTTPSVTGRVLYPICQSLYVQWPELVASYGNKAKYRGWVLE